VIEAPTGYGKSAISQAMALRSITEGLKFVAAFPLRTLLEDQLSKFRAVLSRRGLSEGLVGVRYMHHPESKYLVRPITLTTVDTLSLTLFGLSPEDLEKAIKYYDGTSTGSLGHYLFSRAMVLLSDLVLDEVHLLSDSTKSLNFLVSLMLIFAAHGGRVVLMSATIPRALEDLLRENIEGLSFVRFSESPDEGFLAERRGKRYEISLEGFEDGKKYDGIMDFLREGWREGFRRSIVVFNTVREAIEFYGRAKKGLNISGNRMLLIHSRFTEEDRRRIEDRIKGFRDLDEYLIVSTQVIEAGLDISSDLFVTDIAPASSLVQRLGRFLRYDEKEGRVMIWYEAPDGVGTGGGEGERYKGVYDPGLVRKTLEFLQQHSAISFHVPESYENLLNYVYDEDSFSVERKEVDEMILMNNVVEDPSLAVRKFLELEGSFVREDMMVPVIPSSMLGEMTSEVLNKLIPMNLSSLRRIKPTEEILRGEDDPKQLKRVPVEEYFWRRPSHLILRHVLSARFVAFIVEASYDGELGMVMGHE